MNEYKHTTACGNRIPLPCLQTSHLNHIIKLIERKAQDGVTITYRPSDTAFGGSFDSCSFDIPDDEYVTGQEALDILNYDKYIAERTRRIANGGF